jgi:hypothetical protein
MARAAYTTLHDLGIEDAAKFLRSEGRHWWVLLTTTSSITCASNEGAGHTFYTGYQYY